MIQWQAFCSEKQISDMKPLFGELQNMLTKMETELLDFRIGERPEMEDGLKGLIRAGGKRLRPCLAWVCYQMGTSQELPILPLMCMLELMHTASLVHDDIVDDAAYRRNVPTIHSLTNRRTAVESGDFLLGKAMEYLKVYRGTGINEILADVSAQMCRGEFSQMENLYQTAGQDEETYLMQCRQKTAYLIAASCSCGAAAGGLDQTQKDALRDYGEGIGIAFQLKDDLLDFTADQAFGKKRGQDLKNGIFTLPVLYAFSKHPDPAMIRLAERRDKTQADLEQILAYVKETKGIEYTLKRIDDVTKDAVSRLSVLPESMPKQALIRMAEALGQRTV